MLVSLLVMCSKSICCPTCPSWEDLPMGMGSLLELKGFSIKSSMLLLEQRMRDITQAHSLYGWPEHMFCGYIGYRSRDNKI